MLLFKYYYLKIWRKRPSHTVWCRPDVRYNDCETSFTYIYAPGARAVFGNHNYWCLYIKSNSKNITQNAFLCYTKPSFDINIFWIWFNISYSIYIIAKETRAKARFKWCETMFHNQLQRFALVFHTVKDGALGAIELAYIIIDVCILNQIQKT